jgi:hypothetical protein
MVAFYQSESEFFENYKNQLENLVFMLYPVVVETAHISNL